MTRAPRIRVLPAELVDQIAAGEVVERPASVVKELVENALDAGARRVEVEIEGGGRRLIRVVDDGTGMTAEEAGLALLRHATSKLERIEDLFTLATMGFRGEALPSIAAVSRLAIVTRPGDALEAVRIDVEGGRVEPAAPAGAPVGTQVEVRDLLWNLPARLKFLKADATEAAHITDAVTRLALAHPAIHFRLRHGGRVALDAPPHGSRLERARHLLGRKLAARLFLAEGEEAGVRVEAILAPPDEAQATGRGVQLFVGARGVRDRGLLHAVGMGYGELLPRGRFPTAILFVELPPGQVDVNVHPQKTEVRFARPQEVFAAVRHVVARALAGSPWLAAAAAATQSPMYAVAAAGPPPRPAPVSELAGQYADRQEILLGGWGRTGRPEAASPVRAGSSGYFGSMLYLGQLDRTYLVCEGAGELVIVDQHAAHERIAFQRLKKAHEESGARTQRLLFPRVLELPPSDLAVAEECQAALASIGFELEGFGGRSLALRAAPVELRPEEAEPTLRQLLGELADRDASRAAADHVDDLLATVACHSVVRAGDPLSPDEARALLGALDDVDFRAHCPHGRPVLLRISVAEIGKRLGR